MTKEKLVELIDSQLDLQLQHEPKHIQGNHIKRSVNYEIEEQIIIRRIISNIHYVA